MNTKERTRMIRESLAILVGKDDIVELRVPNSQRGAVCSLMTDSKALARAAAAYSGRVPGVFISLNPVKRSLAGHVTNELAKASVAARDTDIECRRWLPIDFDPVRPSNTPSTDAEHTAAIEMAKQCRDWLGEMDWSDPILADSGNGAHLLYRVELPNDESTRELVKNVLEVISLRFSDRSVVVDTGNFNASRIWRVYGTLNCKGEASEDRPHRRAKMLEVPDYEMEIVSRRELHRLASRLPVTGDSGRNDKKENVDVARWITEHNVPVVVDVPWNNGGHKWILSQCPWNESHKNRSAFIVQFRDGGVDAGCLHKSCEGGNWPRLRALYERKNKSIKRLEPASHQGNVAAQKKSKPKDLLLDLDGEMELFSTPQGDAYASVCVKDHTETHAVKSRAFELFLRHKYYIENQTAPRHQAIREAVAHFSAVAMFDRPKQPVSIRVATAGDMNYFDLGNARWQSVEFDADGWRIVNPSVKFRRSPGMLPLPTPLPGGNINDLRTFLNLRSRRDWVLFISTVLAGLLSRGPYPVLGLHGEAGSAKTTTSRIIRAMLDPNSAPARAMPRDHHDLVITASHGWVLVFDNLSYLPGWFSDDLCRLSTGGGSATRQLYTDEDEIIFDGQRPVILNGVEELPTRTDLLDRSILLDLPVIENYRQEREFWREFEAARPRLLGALLDVAVAALRHLPNVHLDRNPRLADFAVLATAAEDALGLASGAFMRAYSRNRENSNAVALEASPIASLITRLVATDAWQGTAEDLLRRLCGMADAEVQRRRSWPRNPKVLSGMVRRLATSLRRAGINVRFERDCSPHRTRMIFIEHQEPTENVAA